MTNAKIKRAIKATEDWMKSCKDKERYTDYGLTIYGCETRNLEYYKEMLEVKDKRKLTGFHRDLYRAI